MLVNSADFHEFLHHCSEKELGGFAEVYVPLVRKTNLNKTLQLGRLQPGSTFVLDRFRARDPAKILLYLFREPVTGRARPPAKRLIAGIKACDLRALQLLDQAMVNDTFYDPAYKNWRENTTIITCDCNDITDSCHCTLVNGSPYAESGFDLNLSKLNDYYFIETGSKKGEQLFELIQKHTTAMTPPDDLVQERQHIRAEMVARLKNQNRNYQQPSSFQKLVAEKNGTWHDAAMHCIGCGACTNICPTCYCLMLNDESDDRQFIKVRSYDSCQLHGYARVAGGGSPRLKMDQRFRNRYLCKFCFMKNNFDALGCTGCGRCIDACPAGIDIREVVSGFVGKPLPRTKKSDVEELSMGG